MALSSETLLGSGVTTPTGYTHAASSLTLSGASNEAAVLTIAASGVVNADPVVGFTALDAAIKTACDGTNLLGFGVDTTGNTIEAQYSIEKVVRDHGTSDYGTTDNFLVNVRISWVKL